MSKLFFYLLLLILLIFLTFRTEGFQSSEQLTCENILEGVDIYNQSPDNAKPITKEMYLVYLQTAKECLIQQIRYLKIQKQQNQAVIEENEGVLKFNDTIIEETLKGIDIQINENRKVTNLQANATGFHILLQGARLLLPGFK
jgi:hypothetical protein